MNNPANKDKMKLLGALVFLLGMSLSKYMGNKYGVNGRLSIGVFGVVLGLMIVIVLIYIKKYLGALVVFFTFLFFIIGLIGLIGIYLDNIYIVIAGLILALAFLKIIIKVLPRFNKKIEIINDKSLINSLNSNDIKTLF
ncbi:hypothetical protein [Clostridium thailandense]|uniref:hypothetical protein n=1 Tax=Clostridium thailandense TaxID=2794346 RepID=UPI00398A38BE